MWFLKDMVILALAIEFEKFDDEKRGGMLLIRKMSVDRKVA